MEVEMEKSAEESDISKTSVMICLDLADHDYADHDYAISVQDIFSLKYLPVNIFSKLLGMLKQNDKNNLRLTCKCMNNRVIQVDISLRKWNINVTPDTFQRTLEVLSVGIAKLESVQTDPKIALGFTNFSKSLAKLDSLGRTTIIKTLLRKFGRYVTRLDLTIHGDETYLLQDQYRLPNLVTFAVVPSPSKKDRGRFRYPTPKKCGVFEDLLVAYGKGLKNLGVQGLWNINTSGKKSYPLNSMETVNLSVSKSGSLENLVTVSGQFISTLELYDVSGITAGEICYLPNLKNLSIDSNNMHFFDFVKRNTKNLESLVFYCDNPIKDFFPRDLKEFEKLKLLEVNCPVLNYAILLKCTQSLEYLYVPEQEMRINWHQINLKLPIGLPNLKDLCVSGNERWGINMIKKNCASLEYLIIFGYKELDEFLEGCEEMEDLSNEDYYDMEDEENDSDDEENDSDDEENDSDDEENDSNDEENDSINEEKDSMDEDNNFEDEENDSNDEENDSNDEENDSNDEENDSNDEENYSNDEENDFNDEENNSNDEENDYNDMDIGAMENLMGVFNDPGEGETAYCWPDLVAMNCRFPKLKMLFLPDCTETSIVESLAAKCPPGVKVVTDQKLVGEAVKSRITECYPYSTYWRMIHPSLLKLFKFD